MGNTAQRMGDWSQVLSPSEFGRQGMASGYTNWGQQLAPMQSGGKGARGPQAMIDQALTSNNVNVSDIVGAVANRGAQSQQPMSPATVLQQMQPSLSGGKGAR